MAFHCANKMTLRVIVEKLPMYDVNVFANINDHKFIGLCFAFPRACPGFRFEKGNQFKRRAKLIDKNGKIDMNLAWQRVKDATNRRRDKRRIVKERL
jgi:hypothetical protein